MAIPANGVIYVETCQSTHHMTLGRGHQVQRPDLQPAVNGGRDRDGGVTVGDAIVQGTVNSPMTIGSANNIVIDGNICYADTVSGGQLHGGCPAAPSTDVLGLVADNYVEINHPVDSGGNNVSPARRPSARARSTCDLSNPYIDAVILALNHSFLVNNYNTGNPLGTINIYGTIDQDWRGPVGTFNGGGIASGYAKNYQYDPRLVYLSPPYYLNPGTSQWGFAAFTVDAGPVQAGHGLAQHRGLHRVPLSRSGSRRRQCRRRSAATTPTR